MQHSFRLFGWEQTCSRKVLQRSLVGRRYLFLCVQRSLTQPELPRNWPDTACTLCVVLLSSALFCFPKGQSQPEQGCTPLGLTGKAKGSRAKQKLTGKAKGSG